VSNVYTNLKIKFTVFIFLVNINFFYNIVFEHPVAIIYNLFPTIIMSTIQLIFHFPPSPAQENQTRRPQTMLFGHMDDDPKQNIEILTKLT
jgi:hypothetical protein